MTTSPTPQGRAARVLPAAAHSFSPAIAVGFVLLFAAPAAAQQEWRHHGGNPAETRYSPLDQIDAGNVDGLEMAWSWEIPKTGARIEATPLIADGVLYATGPFSIVFALDAATGAEMWRWDPAIPTEDRSGPRTCCGDVNRGAAPVPSGRR